MSEALTRAQAAVQQLQDRLRATAQLLIAEIGAAGPENAESVAGRAVATIQRQAEEIARLKDILQYVADCEPDGQKYLTEAKALADDYGSEQAAERDSLRGEVKELEAEIARWKAAAKWAATVIVNEYEGSASERRPLAQCEEYQRAQRILEEA